MWVLNVIMANFERYQDPSDITALTTSMYMECPCELREKLEAHNALQFVPYNTGLFPASELPTLLGTQTGMDMAWMRDNAHVGMALLESGKSTEAAAVGKAFLSVLHNNRSILDVAAQNNTLKPEQYPRLPVRVHGRTLENDREQRVQNDSVGYTLWLTSNLIHKGVIQPTAEDLDVLAQTVHYLDRVQYWHDKDQGHWEEDSRIHASSIGVVLGGLRDAERMFNSLGYRHALDIPGLMQKGIDTCTTLLNHGITDISGPDLAYVEQHGWQTWLSAIQSTESSEGFSIHKRRFDAALLFLIEPLDVLSPSMAEKIVLGVEQNLLRNKGIARYIGDTYWSPGFKELLTIEERTTSAEGRLDLRNASAAKVAATQTEAQWTLSDPIISTYWGKRYQQTGNPEHFAKQCKHLDRSLAQLATQEDGSMKLPELYYHQQQGIMDDSFAETQQYALTPGDHTPLLWSQANLLHALSLFEANSR